MLNISFNAQDIQDLFASALPLATVNPSTRKLLLCSCSVVTYFTNNGNVPIAMDIYDIMVRRDMPLRNSSSDNDPESFWFLGLGEAGAPGSQIVVGVTPFQAPAFCENYLIKKVSKVQMAEGSTHEHRVKISPNRAFNLATLENNDAYLRGWSYFTMGVIRGFPARDHTQVSTAPASVLWVTSKKYTFGTVGDAETQVNVLNNLSALASPNILNVGDGAVDPVTFA